MASSDYTVCGIFTLHTVSMLIHNFASLYSVFKMKLNYQDQNFGPNVRSFKLGITAQPLSATKLVFEQYCSQRSRRKMAQALIFSTQERHGDRLSAQIKDHNRILIIQHKVGYSHIADVSFKFATYR